jgi:hypothetical protein
MNKLMPFWLRLSIFHSQLLNMLPDLTAFLHRGLSSSIKGSLEVLGEAALFSPVHHDVLIEILNNYFNILSFFPSIFKNNLLSSKIHRLF